jgi:release factor glutamine methyltransferase
VAAEASLWLAAGGSLLVETSEWQESQACETARRGGLVPRVARSAELAVTVLIATRPAS